MTYNVFGGTLNLVQLICSQTRSQLVDLVSAAAWQCFPFIIETRRTLTITLSQWLYIINSVQSIIIGSIINIIYCYSSVILFVEGRVLSLVTALLLTQGSHASWKVQDCFLKFSGPGKSWKMILVLESCGIYLWFNLTNVPIMYRTPCVNKCMKHSCCVLT